MKKWTLLLLATVLLLPTMAQHFDQHFIDKTLRINYLHIGNNNIDSIVIDSYHAGAKWTGTRGFLVDETRLGDVLFEAFDDATNELIFTRSYSCLFNEYRTTERAESEVGRFEEVVQMPFPKAKIRYSFTNFDRKKVGKTIYSGTFDPATATVVPFTKEYKTMNLHIGGDAKQCMDILFLPDGYAKADKKRLEADMKRFADYIMNCSPFKENADKINICAIKGYSEESGITDPNKEVFKRTLFNSSYNVIDVDRYLMCLNVWKMNEVADDAPYDIIVLVANSPKYGGGGIYNFYCTVNNLGFHSDYVIVHELGHLIAGLGDEYFTSEVSVRDYYPEGVEPVEPNLTTLVDFDSKWKSMLEAGTPVPTPDAPAYDNKLGVFEGGGYVAEGVYRPWRNCTMKEAVYNNFCPVCTKALINSFNYFAK